MDEETLNSILQEKVKPDTTFLSELNKQEEANATGYDISKTNNVSEGKYHCKYSDGFSSDSLTDLMSHYRATHPEHKGTNRIKKEKALLEEQKDDINTEVKETMSDEDNQETSLETMGPTEVEIAKPKKEKRRVESDISQIPSDYDRLSSLLQSFGVPNWKGVIEGMKLYDIRDINILKDLLRNVSTPQGKSDAVVKMWSEIQGINKPTMDNISSSTTKSVTPTDALSLMAKLRDEEIQDSIVSSYQTKQKGKELENELLRKRLNGELSEGKGMSEMEKLITMMQLMQPKDNGINDLKLELIRMQGQPKDNGVSELKVELSKLQSQLLSTPRTDPQVEILKQQIDLQNKKYEDIQRQISEDAKLKLLSDQHKQEMDILKQQIGEQSKQTQELIKSVQLASAPKSEDILHNQITEMQKQSDLKLQELQKQFNQMFELKRDEENRKTIETLKEEIKSVRESSGGQISQVAESMKDFATNITHAFEKKELNDQHSKETEELKKKITDIEHNKSLTNEQYVMEKTSKLAEEAVKALGAGIDGFGKALQPATKSAAESSAIMERAALAMDLKSKGFDAQTINNVLTQQSRPSVPSARQEFENLARVTQEIRNEIPISQTQNINPSETLSETSTEPIKFATNDKD